VLWDGGWVAAGGGVMPGFQLSTIPLRHCRSAVGGQPMSVLVTSSLCIRQYISSISVLTRNGSYGTEERQRYNGTAERNGETAERQRNGGNQALVYSSTEVEATCHAVHAAEVILSCHVACSAAVDVYVSGL